jgi:Tol biopolymer transport system component
MTIVPRVFASLASLTLLIACESPRSGAESALAPRVGGIQAMSFANSEWSEPVNLGAAINTAANEFDPTLSPDELSLYFNVAKPGGVGLGDIWVSQRACRTCLWEPAVNLGPGVNSTDGDGGPVLSIDGHLLFFHSNRPGGQGGRDIYMCRRVNPNDDFGWGPPVNLGPDVNTALEELNPEYLQSAEDGAGNLYFHRGSGTDADIYSASVTRRGEPLEPAALVSELSQPAATDASPTIRSDGREILFVSGRPGTLGGNDIWVSTRRSVHDLWSTPVALAAPPNTLGTEGQPDVSSDGRTLLFSSNQAGGFGGMDIYISTRTPNGKEAP